jgi:mannose-6-phosphate isomerase-like protein (cupin superfamily)
VHVHEHTEEGFCVLRGQLALWRDGHVAIRDTGSYTVVRTGERHSFWNPTDEPAAYLTTIAPPDIANYVRELAHGLGDSPSAEEAAALRGRLSGKYDFRVAGPPPPR